MKKKLVFINEKVDLATKIILVALMAIAPIVISDILVGMINEMRYLFNEGVGHYDSYLQRTIFNFIFYGIPAVLLGTTTYIFYLSTWGFYKNPSWKHVYRIAVLDIAFLIFIALLFVVWFSVLDRGYGEYILIEVYEKFVYGK